MVFFKLGYRNIFRNKRRSLLTIIVIGMGICCYIIYEGIMVGVFDHMINGITKGLISEGQVERKDFGDDFSIDKTIFNQKESEEILKTDPQVKAFSRRIITNAMLSSPSDMKNIVLYGINPADESKVSNIAQNLKAGRLLPNENSIYISEALANRLNLELGDKLVLTGSEAKTSELAQELFRVHGLFNTGMRSLDLNIAYIRFKSAQKLFKLNDQYHQIAIQFKDRTIGEKTNYPLWTKLASTGNSAKSWRIIATEFKSIAEMTGKAKAITALILFFIIALAIINTLFMILYERMFEFGLLQALGTKTKDIILLVFFEATALSFFSTIAGIIMSLFFGGLLSVYGLDGGGAEFAGASFAGRIYFVFKIEHFIIYPIFAFILTSLVSLYPAVHLTRIPLANALKKSL